MNRPPNQLHASDYAEPISEFEKRFPKPEETPAFYRNRDLWRAKREGWLEAHKTIATKAEKDGWANTFAYVKKENEVLENENY